MKEITWVNIYLHQCCFSSQRLSIDIGACLQEDRNSCQEILLLEGQKAIINISVLHAKCQNRFYVKVFCCNNAKTIIAADIEVLWSRKGQTFSAACISAVVPFFCLAFTRTPFLINNLRMSSCPPAAASMHSDMPLTSCNKERQL